ncbi:MAG: sigma-70 family RNA polymerase sigma factor [Candidatus Hydrogenedentes bacterium]|nr:sigma-70 family RNA polymerase sigma factor [Candidatus Hydrogenedentota bacterium]
MPAADTELLTQWIDRRDPDAFRVLVSRYASMVYATCRRVVGNATEAEDIAQECFETLARMPKGPQGHFGAWLHTVATNRALNRLKTERRRTERETRFATENAEPVEVNWDDVYRYVDEAIAALPEKLRAPLVAYYLEGQSHADIAAAIAVPRRTVTHRIDRGVDLIRGNLKSRGVPIATVSLAAMLGSNMAEAAPAALTATLGRIALAGVRPLETGTAATLAKPLIPGWLITGGTLAMPQKVGVGVVAALVALLLVWFWPRNENSTVADQVTSDPKAGPTESQPGTPAANNLMNAISQFPPIPARSAKDTPDASTTDKTPPESASLAGNVIDDAGNPVDAAQVRLEISADNLGFDVRGVYHAVTDAAGAFRIAGIREFGDGRVSADREGYVQAVSRALRIQQGGARTGVKLLLKKAHGFVSGWVVNSQQRPIEGAEVDLRHFELKWPLRGGYFTGEAKMVSAFTDANGHFWIGIPEQIGNTARASCDFAVTKTGFGAGFFPDVSTGTEDALFVLQTGGAISGKVTREDGAPVEGAVVRATGAAELSGPQKGAMPAQIPPVEASTNADGLYLLSGLGADYRYTVNVQQSTTPSLGSAPRTGVEVRPNQTTSGIDFTLRRLDAVRVFGKASEGQSGLPAYPIRVKATVINPGADFVGDPWAMTETAADGSYTLSLQLSRKADLRIEWSYADGAHVYPKNNSLGAPPPRTPAEMDQEVKLLRETEPGQEHELNFSVVAPIVVPIRFVDPANRPLLGIEAAVRQGSSEWGSKVISGLDGRATFRGLCPAITFQILAYANDAERIQIGESAPFSGAPGETLQELIVVCRHKGGVEGVIVDKQGRPVANMEIGCTAVLEDGTVVKPSATTTAEDGSFTILHGLPHDTYAVVAVGYVRDGQVETGFVKNVEVVEGVIVNLGAITCEPLMSVEQAAAMAQQAQQAQ